MSGLKSILLCLAAAVLAISAASCGEKKGEHPPRDQELQISEQSTRGAGGDAGGGGSPPADATAQLHGVDMLARIRTAHDRAVDEHGRERDQKEFDRLVTLVSAEQSQSSNVLLSAEQVVAQIQQSGASQDQVDSAADAAAEVVVWAGMAEMYGPTDPRVPPMPDPNDVRLADPIFEIPTFTSDPVQPGGRGPRDESSADRDQAMKSLMTMLGAGLCIAKPPLCPVVMAFLASMGTGENLQRDVQMLQGIHTAVKDGEWNEDLIERVAKRIEETTDAEHLTEISGAITEASRIVSSEDPLNELLRHPEITKVLEEKVYSYLQAEKLLKLMNKIEEGASADEVVLVLDAEVRGQISRRVFRTQENKSMIHAAIKLLDKNSGRGDRYYENKYWDGALRDIPLSS